jgi:uncharacterized membrane protein
MLSSCLAVTCQSACCALRIVGLYFSFWLACEKDVLHVNILLFLFSYICLSSWCLDDRLDSIGYLSLRDYCAAFVC